MSNNSYRRIKSKERKNGMRYCTFCKPSRVRACWRNVGVPIEANVELSCEEHKHLLTDWGGPNRDFDWSKGTGRDDGDKSEAEFQIEHMFGIKL